MTVVRVWWTTAVDLRFCDIAVVRLEGRANDKRISPAEDGMKVRLRVVYGHHEEHTSLPSRVCPLRTTLTFPLTLQGQFTRPLRKEILPEISFRS